jgi:large subunit ribosomal protein L6
MRVWSLEKEKENGGVQCIVNKESKSVEIRGPLGGVVQVFKGNDVVFGENQLLVKSKSSYGYVISRIKGILEGVQRGYYLELQLVGRGYRFMNLTNHLVVKLGSLYGLQYKKPEGVHIFSSRTKLVIFGVDLEEVNRVGSVIKGFKRPDAYKGKGIRAAGEIIKLKAGKK